MLLNNGILGYLSMKPMSGHDIKKLLLSDSLNREERLAFLDLQLKIKVDLIRILKDNYEENGDLFAEIAGLPEGDRKLDSATYACRWGILRGEAYGKLLEEINTEILANKDNLNYN